ncbi:MAG TPA: TonB family protein [Puia sp.]|nr:TonB family protein [Puia sp.]
MNLILFLSKTIIISGLLFSYYYLFLRNKRFHQYNRFYLLGIPFISVCLPLMNFPIPGFQWQNQSVAIKLLDVVNAANWEEPVVITPRSNLIYHLLSWQNIACTVFILILLMFLIAFIKNIWRIKKIASKYSYTKFEDINFYQTEEPEAPFSFLKNIFWNTQIDTSTPNGKQIFRHELFHVKQNHTADILFMELTSMVFWLNPFFLFVKKEIKTVHEFLADQYAANETNSHEYAELLVLSAATKNNFQITHPFFNHQLKRRIAMLTNFKQNRYGYISRLMALPLLFVLVCAFAVNLKPVSSFAKFISPKKVTVVVDAGHGGKYNGTISSSGVQEKDINLAIAKEIEQLAKDYNINVIMTREKDQAVGNANSLSEDLQNRINIASANNADAFISIHVDADITPTTDKSGFGIFIPTIITDNYNKSKTLASAITEELKNVYTTEEKLKERDKGVAVLDKNSVPAIMIECGYITNKKDIDFIMNPSNQEKIARHILQGIAYYSAEKVQAGQIKRDTLSPEEANKINPNDISSMNVLKEKNIAIVHFKSGDSAIINLKDFKKNPSSSEDYDKTFTKVEVEAEYPGGQSAWGDYLTKNLKYPQEAINKELQGIVVMQFIVNTDGTISDIKILKSPAKVLSDESIRVLKESGKWTPAMQNGKAVRAYKKQPIVFKLERQK